jgi:hypothetical protein
MPKRPYNRQRGRTCQTCGKTFTGRKRFFCDRQCAGTKLHGLTDTPEFFAWRDMIGRCRNEGHHNYPKYGARGICVCERWQDFDAFLLDMGPRPGRGYSIDRIDNDGNYEPENCRWATQLQQNRNRSNSWTQEQVARLRQGFSTGLRYAEIAKEVGRTPGAVYGKARKMGLTGSSLN